MRALAMLHAYPPTHNAGAEWAAHSMLRELAARGHTVEVLLSQPSAGRDSYVLDGVTVHPHRGKADPVPWLRGDQRADVLVTHLENTPRASVLGEIHKIPVVHLLHNTFEKSKSWIHQGSPSMVVYNTAWMAEDASAWWRIHRGDRPMPWGLTVHPPVAVADYLTAPGDRVTLINLTVAKGAATLYGLAERMPDVQFLGVIGGYGHQVLREDLPNVEIVPHTPGGRMAKDVYARTRILLAPSSYESYGRVAVEAMCSGIPVIAHPTPGLRESCGDAGIFCDRDDLEAWQAAIETLDDPGRYAAASTAAAARAAGLDPAAELDRFCRAMEGVARRGRL